MEYRTVVVNELSKLIGKNPPFKSSSLCTKVDALVNYLDFLNNYKVPEDFVLKGVRPTPPETTRGQAQYKMNLAHFININTGMELESTSTVHTRLYESILKYFERLWSKKLS